MTQYYVCIQWDSDKHWSLPYQNMNLVAGPFDYAKALSVRAELARLHRQGSETDRDLNEYVYGRPNDYTSTDTGQYFIRSVDELRTQRDAGTIRLNYHHDYRFPYQPERLS